MFAASTESHLLDEPRSARFARFRAGFDERGSSPSSGGRGFGGSRVAIASSRRGCGRSTIRRPASSSAGLRARPARSRHAVAVVGARACSAYGSQVAGELGAGLARAGVVVVSGLARGIDAAAHRGALESGATVAVLGCGIDRDYPRAHRSLAASIEEIGLIVSEYPPGVEPAPWRFPARNRIVAGLCDATVVVEARERSGALITADLALDEGRDVLAVPGEVTSLLSKGTNALLRLGAVPVTCVEDVLAVVGLEAVPTSPAALDPRLAAVRAAVADAPARG